MFKFKSKTLNDIKTIIYAYLTGIGTCITLMSGILQNWINEYSKIVSSISIILLVIILFFIIKLIVDEKFIKLESIEHNLEDKALNKIDDIKNTITNLNDINENLKKLEKIEYISSTIENINKNMIAEFAEHIFIQNKETGYIILILKNDNCNLKDYELNINSLHINSIIFEEEMSLDNQNINNITFSKLNNCKNGYSLNNINFSIKKGINIGIIKMYLREDPKGVIKFTILLKERKTDRIIIDNNEYTLME
ncbi:hypothetical protein [Tepidibacter mesophilus]|uniref:hypothetical protein n=1 Tax=Tepidibacter mesophilus TaxID=655607 RepID=UPI000C08096C|nr:hypothetical protein [Tepidibacter mesophilus]